MRNYERIHRIADNAGLKAAKACKPEVMYVHDRRLNKTYTVPGGVCGFAWVELKGNTGFGRWAKGAGVASKGYPSGLAIRANVGGQSMETKAAYAHAYAAVLERYGVAAHAVSRMD